MIDGDDNIDAEVYEWLKQLTPDEMSKIRERIEIDYKENEKTFTTLSQNLIHGALISMLVTKWCKDSSGMREALESYAYPRLLELFLGPDDEDDEPRSLREKAIRLLVGEGEQRLLAKKCFDKVWYAMFQCFDNGELDNESDDEMSDENKLAMRGLEIVKGKKKDMG
jgi:hypothetical protein